MVEKLKPEAQDITSSIRDLPTVRYYYAVLKKYNLLLQKFVEILNGFFIHLTYAILKKSF